MDKYTGSKKLGIAHFPSLSKPNNHSFVCLLVVCLLVYHNKRYKRHSCLSCIHSFIYFFCFYFFSKALYIWSGTRFNLVKIKVIQTQNIFLCHASSLYNKHVMITNSTRITSNTYSTLNFILFTSIFSSKERFTR